MLAETSCSDELYFSETDSDFSPLAFFTFMAIQQRSRLTKRLPYAMTHRYFLVLPLSAAFITQEVTVRRYQKKVNQQYLRNQGYYFDEKVQKWLRRGPPTQRVFG